ncbi:MAG: glycoside hydrolase family 92 protein [Flavobacteriales bacterium]|nr:GH92 family glycosyl hydrolase [Flavobacteriales bacterium]MCB9167142.1 glycoside hydrolase family 92 protein [Flavobacteriales bacterium]
MSAFVRASLLGLVLLPCAVHAQPGDPDLLRDVDPMIGTQRMGHVYPGATAPFGMVQVSPDTDTLPYAVNGRYDPAVYRTCSGYQYDDSTIVGFSHTHFSGTGHSDLGDVLLMPTCGTLQLDPGTADAPEKGFRSVYHHRHEHAAPGYYSVLLEDDGIRAELTATTRVGLHRYTFPRRDGVHVILDLVHGIYNYPDKNVWTFVRVENDTLVTGYRQTNGWARTRTVYFAIAFNKPITHYGQQPDPRPVVYHGFWGKFDQTRDFPEMAGRQLRAWFDLDLGTDSTLLVKVALSSVSTAGALNNMQAEVPQWDFDGVVQATQDAWRQELGRITITSDRPEVPINFYTAMYHACLSPTVYMDVDGRYRGLDQNVHLATGFTNYTTFSLWDTYRALHPLFNIIQRKRSSDLVNSMLAHYDQSAEHMLPVWSHYANENWCMIGYHSVSVIADACVKGITGFDVEHALDACVETARTVYYGGLGDYMEQGYVPEDRSGSSVSKTLEYAYDDRCIAHLAERLGRTDLAKEFMARSFAFRQVWDSTSHFMRPRHADGSFLRAFDPLATDQPGFVEGNAWNYSLYVPQEPAELAALYSGPRRFREHLDSLFTMPLDDKYFANTEDITRDGVIGNYVHGNEPSHHVCYLYNYTDRPWMTGHRARQVMAAMYRPGPDGLSGNDDCGQMSAWYIFSALGFYPMEPGTDRYELGAPVVGSAGIHLENGRTFTVRTKGQGERNTYVQRVLLNGKPLDRTFILHHEIMDGGELLFELGPKPPKH